jgi:hypothetical protein
MNVEGKMKNCLFYSIILIHTLRGGGAEVRDEPERRLEGQQFTKLPDPEKVHVPSYPTCTERESSYTLLALPEGDLKKKNPSPSLI